MIEDHKRAEAAALFFNIIESDGRLVIDWDYRSDLFDSLTMERWTDHFCELLKGVVQNHERPIGELPLVAQVRADGKAGEGR